MAGHETTFKVEFEGGKEGLEGIVDLALSGNAGEYVIGEMDAASPLTEAKATVTVNANGAYRLHAALMKEREDVPKEIKLKPFEEAGFRIQDKKRRVSRTTFGSATAALFSPQLPRYSPIYLSVAENEAVTLDLRINPNGLTRQDVGKTVSEFSRATAITGGDVYRTVSRQAPQQTLYLGPGERVQRINRQRTQPAAPAKPQSPASHDDEIRISLEAMSSNVTFADIGGYQRVKDELRDLLMAINDTAEAARHGYTPSKGVLLHGPPGTGKTMFGKALASEARAEFIYFNAADALQMYVGQSTKTLKAAFEGAQKKAGETGKPVILFIDEIDSIFPERGTAHDVKTDLVNLFNQYMDGFESGKIPGVYVVAATNRLHEMDESATRAGRFVKVEVPLPDLEASIAIFKVTQEVLEKEAGMQLFDSGIDYRPLGVRTEKLKFSGADIAAVMRATRQAAFRQAVTAKQGAVIRTTAADLEAQTNIYRQEQGPYKGPMGFGRHAAP